MNRGLRLSVLGKMSSVIFSHQMLQQLRVIGIYADLIRHAEAEAEADPAAAIVQTTASAAAIEDALGGVTFVLRLPREGPAPP